MELYDESAAIARMRKAIPDAVSSGLDDDEFLNIIDMIMDWMEDNGLDDIEAGEDDIDNDREQLLAVLVPHVTGLLKRDKGASFPVEYVPQVIEAELDYEDEIATL
ncbi:MAG: hypothetical protein J1E84_00545 [Muribaculaceae bacterium]|nr:hypothetical protein [Muribaculaceae bacterium]